MARTAPRPAMVELRMEGQASANEAMDVGMSPTGGKVATQNPLQNCAFHEDIDRLLHEELL